MKIIDAQCRAVFGSTGRLSFEVYIRMSPNISSRVSSSGKEISDNALLKRCIEFFNKKIRPTLLDYDFSSQQQLDALLLSLFQQSGLPSTFFSVISIAFAKVGSYKEGSSLHSYLEKFSKFSGKVPPPLPIFNILDATNFYSNTPQTVSFLLVPAVNIDLMDSLILGSRVLEKTKEICWENQRYRGNSSQGGVLINLNDCEEGFNLIIKAAAECGYHVGKNFTLGIDFESEYFKTSQGAIFPWSNKPLSREEHFSCLLKWVEEFPLSYIEDPFVNSELEDWCTLKEKLPHSSMLVADKPFSLFLSNKTKLKEKQPINSFIIKITRFPTITEIMKTIDIGLALNWSPVVSHRSIDNNDTFISHLAVASGSKYMKAGGMCNMEHIDKYNELMRIFNG